MVRNTNIILELPHHMKDTLRQLEDQLSFLDMHLSRLKCLSNLIIGLIELRTVNLSQLSLCFEGEAKQSSVFRRIQRFLATFTLPYNALSVYLWNRFQSQEATILSLDRTNWKFGRVNINILMLSICHDGLGIPLMWTVLGDKRGNSSQEERIALMERFMSVIEPDQIVRLTADREFIGSEWLNWLDDNHIHFVIRIRNNQWVEHSSRKSQQASSIFSSEKWRVLRKQRVVGGTSVFIGGQRLQSGDFLILISNQPMKGALYYYAKRWDIEILFGALKTRGFNFEDTHITAAARINNLIGLLSIALAWAVIVGDWITQKGKNIPIKKHGRRARSIFAEGLAHLRAKIFTNKDLSYELLLLSCT